jgi:hypothetical protein
MAWLDSFTVGTAMRSLPAISTVQYTA